MVVDAGERRLYHRFPLQISLVVLSRDPSGAMAGMTRDLSAQGVYFHVPREVEGTSIEFILAFPPEVAGGREIDLHCHGRVVRTEPTAAYGVGIAALIEGYEFDPSEPSSG